MFLITKPNTRKCVTLINMKYFYNFNNKFCNLFVIEDSKAICNISFTKNKIPADSIKKETPLIKNAINQLDKYFSKNLKIFDLPLTLKGTDFQIKVWEALKKIPYGKTCSYGELAAMIGNPKASRAVGMANNRNPIAIIIPCHRIIGHNGSLTGYAGGLKLKQQLLELENSI